MQRQLDGRLRLTVVALVIFTCFALLLIQFYRVQILEREKWERLAKAQHQTVVKEPFKRGLFYSNTSVKVNHPEQKIPFVVDVPKFHLYIDPNIIPEAHKEDMAKCVSRHLHQSIDGFSTMRKNFYRRTHSRKLASWLSFEEMSSCRAWWNSYAREHRLPRNALYFIEDYKRSYPLGHLLGQVLHTVRDDRDIETGQNLPTGGLEKSFDTYLCGKEGKKVIFRSPKHAIDADKCLVAPENGSDVYLSINHCLQSIVEEELARGVEKVQAKGGWAVMMEPNTGEILAVAHYPFFNPSQYKDYYNDEALVDLTRTKTISDCFEPGSTMKIVSVAIALLANDELVSQGRKPLFHPDEIIRCDQCIFPGRTKPLHDVTGRHKYLNMKLAIQKSSNVYVATLIKRVIDELGANWYRDKLVNVFGLGKKTDIELPYENPGLIPTPGKTYPGGQLEWSSPTPYSLAMGYNLLVNAIQLCKVFCILCNGGYDVNPTLVRKIIHEDSGEVILNHTNRPRLKRVLPEGMSRQLVEAMKFTTKPGGTASLGDIPGYTEGGKTSTSEKLIHGGYSKSTHFCSFAGFTPAKNPRFVLAVGVDEPVPRIIPGFGMTQYGGKCAAPIFREISRRSLQYLGVTPDDPYGFPKGDPRSDPKRADWIQEVQEIAQLYEQYNGV